jgi:hypothetical protein
MVRSTIVALIGGVAVALSASSCSPTASSSEMPQSRVAASEALTSEPQVAGGSRQLRDEVLHAIDISVYKDDAFGALVQARPWLDGPDGKVVLGSVVASTLRGALPSPLTGTTVLVWAGNDSPWD